MFNFFLLTTVQTGPITGTLKIGEELSLVIYLRDPNSIYDVAVRDCWAYDDSTVNEEQTMKLQLTTTEGCVRYLLFF